MTTAAPRVNRLRRTDIPSFLAEMKECTIKDVQESEGVPQSVTFDMTPFRFQMTTASMVNQASHDDLDRVWLWTGFKLDPSIDLPFVNEFNRKGYAASAAITEAGVELHDHFIVAGLGKGEAELVVGHHILGFRREVHEFNLARNERARSLSTN